MRPITPAGTYADVIAVPSPSETDIVLRRDQFVRMGVPLEIFERLRDLNYTTPIAQHYGNVQEGMVFASGLVHLFRGFSRPLMHELNLQGDRDMLMFSWRPRWDFLWDRKQSAPRHVDAPVRRVFTIAARPFDRPDSDGLVGAVLHWCWMDEDPMFEAAPVNSADRFERRIWTKR